MKIRRCYYSIFLFVFCGLLFEPLFVQAQDPSLQISCFIQPPECFSLPDITSDEFFTGEDCIVAAAETACDPVEEDFDELIIRVVKKNSNPFLTKDASGAQYHLVKDGDNLSRIAGYYGVPVNYLMAYNSLNSSRIVLGQRINIPSKASPLIAERPERYLWPLPVPGRISSPFGSRIHPITKVRAFHNGVDLAAKAGTKIICSKSGTVYFSGYQRVSGQTVVIRLPDGTLNFYAHCSKRLVKTGDVVKAGSSIATVGRTGRATGNHLHFSIKKADKYLDPLKHLGK
ncbi:MAG: peptidoglycan DD-metalloendopeptidase family protein [Candidatus Wallbacteria bacterium]|nr:peptidoglycan DD-metalloendopeptidase family protein [Candidatus Wallbacteria bacterium]